MDVVADAERVRLRVAVFDLFISLDLELRKLGDRVLGIQHAELDLLVQHYGGAIIPALHAHARPRHKLVCDLVDERFALGHG